MEEVWNHQDSSYSWPLSQTEQAGEKDLGQGDDQELDGTLTELQFFFGDGRTFQKDNSAALHQSGLYGRVARQKPGGSHSAKTQLKDSNHEKQDSLV